MLVQIMWIVYYSGKLFCIFVGMKLLIVSATNFEIQPLLDVMENVELTSGRLLKANYREMELNFLVTGVGMVATAYHMAKVLDDSYDLALNIGICGSFNKNLDLGAVVHVYEDTLSELGAEDDEQFLNLEQLKLYGDTSFNNIRYGAIHESIESLPRVTGITVNTTHGNEKSIAKVYDRLHPFVESMEGAAFMYVCEQENIPYAQIRSVSNYVEKRNRDAWNIPLAIENLNKKVLEILNAL